MTREGAFAEYSYAAKSRKSSRSEILVDFSAQFSRGVSCGARDAEVHMFSRVSNRLRGGFDTAISTPRMHLGGISLEARPWLVPPSKPSLKDRELFHPVRS